MGLKGIEGLPTIRAKKPYSRKPLNEHAMLSKGALHIKSLNELLHPASVAMKTHISNGFFSGEPKGIGKL